MTPQQRRARFFDLHARDSVFVMPNPWDVGSARLLSGAGFEALATTSAGFAWSLGRDDYGVTRDELVGHVGTLAAVTDLPLNVDSERCFADDVAGVAETVALLHEAGAAGCSIEDWNGGTGTIDPIETATERVAAAAAAAHVAGDPLVLTARCENLLHGIADLDDTIARLIAYRDAGADCVYAPGTGRCRPDPHRRRRGLGARQCARAPGWTLGVGDRRRWCAARVDRWLAGQHGLRRADGGSAGAARCRYQQLSGHAPAPRRPRHPPRLTEPGDRTVTPRACDALCLVQLVTST